MTSLRKRITSALTGPVPLSRERAMGISERLSAATTLVSSLEHLTHSRQIRPGGLNDWQIARDSYRGRSPVTRKALDLLGRREVTTGLHAARVAAAAGLLLPGNSRWRGAANLFLGLSNTALYPRHRYGTDGADQASTLVQTATGVARLATGTQTQDALLWYVAMQSNLSYLISGWVKLLGKDWRSGDALGGVMRTKTYGQHDIWRLTQKYPKAARTLAHGVLALECLFPLLYLKGGRLARPVLASAASFHVANAFAMGLGRFTTSFTAMHPMVAYTSTPRSHPAGAARDDRALATAALAVAAGTAAAGVIALSRRARAADPEPGSRFVTTRHGNELNYTRRAGGGAGDPVLVLVPGLAATPEHFGWITDTLLFTGDTDLVTYQRAGYGASRRRCARQFTLQEAVDDLVDLVGEAVPEGRPVVLAGHSLGGELARRAAAQLGSRLHGIVYLDSSHPDELQRSERQSDSADRLRGGLMTFLNSLRGGLGALLVRPEWVQNLPSAYRGRAMAQYADQRLWKAAVREWDATEVDFRSFSGPLPPVPAHALVISAQQTVDRDPDQLLMHKELADAHRGPGRVVTEAVVEGADHDSVLTKAHLAHQVVQRITGFLAETAAAAPTPAPAPAPNPSHTPAPQNLEDAR